MGMAILFICCNLEVIYMFCTSISSLIVMSAVQLFLSSVDASMIVCIQF
jgi:hypothetical protein